MTGSAESAERRSGRLAALLIDVSAEAISASGGHAAGVYLRSRTPGLLRLLGVSDLALADADPSGPENAVSFLAPGEVA